MHTPASFHPSSVVRSWSHPRYFLSSLASRILQPTCKMADSDSGIDSGVEDNAGSTVSITSTTQEAKEENGRTYHNYHSGKYSLPNDDKEQDRLDLQHHLFCLTFRKHLFTCPVNRPLHRVLDAGTGTGIWAIDFGDMYPESWVKGIDLSPIQPSFTPPNVQFEVDNLELDVSKSLP